MFFLFVFESAWGLFFFFDQIEVKFYYFRHDVRKCLGRGGIRWHKKRRGWGENLTYDCVTHQRGREKNHSVM